MTKLIEPLFCPRCKEEVSKPSSLIREHWCSSCRVWTVGVRVVHDKVSKLKFSYDDMGCYLERE